MKNLSYHHIGIPNVIRRDREDYFASAKMFHTNFDDNPYGIEWLRFEPGSNLPELVKTYPHIAFKVDSMDATLEGKEILIEPTSPSGGVRIAFVGYWKNSIFAGKLILKKTSISTENLLTLLFIRC